MGSPLSSDTVERHTLKQVPWYWIRGSGSCDIGDLAGPSKAQAAWPCPTHWDHGLALQGFPLCLRPSAPGCDSAIDDLLCAQTVKWTVRGSRLFVTSPIGTVDVILSYCHNSLNDSTLINEIPYFTEKRVGVISASPLSMGLLTKVWP